MRILFIVPYAPSLIRVRPCQLISGLARRGHDVVVATLWSNPEELASVEGLQKANVEVRANYLPAWRKGWNCLRMMTSNYPLQAGYSWHFRLVDEITRILRTAPVEIIHVEHLRGALYGLLARKVSGERIPVVWDSVDCISHLFRQAKLKSRSLFGRIITSLELPRTEAYEASLMSQFAHILVTSRCDQQAFVDLARSRNICGAPVPKIVCNGVDLEYFSVSDEVREPATLVMTGKMSYHANITAAKHLVEDIMPRVWERRPDVVVKIVGRAPPKEVRLLATHRSKGETDGASARVIVTGTVSDIRPYLRRATAAVAPIVYGAGVQNKVLEAMACGTAVIATPQANSAINACAGRDILVADEPQAFAEHLLNVLDSPRLREDIGRAGRRFVETHHDWDRSVEALERVYLEALDRVAPKPVHA